MKTLPVAFIQQLDNMRTAYLESGNKSGYRLTQQVITLTDIYTKYDFEPQEFFEKMAETINGLTKIYEAGEIKEKAANRAILDLINSHLKSFSS